MMSDQNRKRKLPASNFQGGNDKKVFMRKRNFNRWKSKEPSLVSPSLPQINLEGRPNRLCPYKAWRRYFPFEEYDVSSSTVTMINIFHQFFANYFQNHNVDDVMLTRCVLLDCKEVSDVITPHLPTFLEDLKDSPEVVINCLGLSAHHYIRKMNRSSPTDAPIIRARLFNFEVVTTLKNVKAREVGKFVSVRGTLVKVSNVRPVATAMTFRCVTCGHLQTLLLVDCNYMTPTKCAGPNCRATRFEPLRDHPMTEITDWQTIKLQEKLSEDQREAGRMPRTIEVELSRDLSDTASPGDIVTITGIVKVKKSEEGRGNKAMFNLYIEGNHVVNARSNTGDARSRTADQNLDFSSLDVAGIEEIRKQRDVFSLLTSSLCPTIFGHNMVKAGLLLCMFGGSYKNTEDSNRIPVRTSSHVLLVGDPGLGKSQLLQAVSRLAPRGVYVCGNTSSSSGLTVTLTRDTGSGDTGLEAGALVLADQGICCIDEFDKMSNQHQALLEAMEQQCISIAKGGIVCSMPARCSVVAAANPVKGHYNKYKTVSENLKMGGALLSRFDLVYILMDTPNQEKDKLLSDHVMALHTGKQSAGNLRKKLAAILPGNTEHEIENMGELATRLAAFSRCDDNDPLPHSLMWKYIAYSRQHFAHITISRDARQVLKEFYLELRSKGNNCDVTPITTRQLESLKRLTEARCRAEMRSVATAQDARDVVEIMKHSLYGTYTDDKNHLDFNRSLHGSGVSKSKKVKKLLAVMDRVAAVKSSKIFNISEIRDLSSSAGVSSDEVGQLIESLNNQGFLIKSGTNLYKLQTTF